jgi:DNA primase
MPRIPEEEVSRLKREVSIVRLAEARGVKLKTHGRDRIGLCPFHDDKEPSLVLSPDKNLWHCLGACQAGGTVVDWVMKAEGVSFRHAVELLRQGELGHGPATPTKFLTKRRPLAAAVETTAEDAELLAQVVAYYHETLKDSPEALAYLEHRGLTHPELVSHFQLGYANRTLTYRLPSKDSQEGKAVRERLARLGLLRESGHEHFNGCVVVPIFDERGQVVGLYGRKIAPAGKHKPGTPLHLYLPGPHRGVFNSAALQASREIILCEALLDALTFWCAGFRHVTSAYGIEGFTAEHLEMMKRHGTERVLIAYDRDEAGDCAAEKLGEQLKKEGIAAWRVQFPRGMDANEYARQTKPAERALELALRTARPMGEGEAPGRPSPQPSPASGRGGQSTVAVSAPPVSNPNPPPPPPALPLTASFPLPPDPSSVLPSSPPPELSLEHKAHEVVLSLGDRRYRVRGLERNLAYDVLKVNLFCSRGDGFHVDGLDLYSARQRATYIKQAALELGVEEKVVQKDLGALLLKLEALQQAQIEAALAPKEKPLPPMSEEERREALALLEHPHLLAKIVEDLSALGVIGEEVNKLTAYLAATSRQLERPLAVIVQSSSAAGKSALLEAVLSLMPEEERVSYSAMTGQSLFYMGETDLKHKILAIAEEAGAEKASYALKLLQSEGQLTIASTGKDPQTGRLVTHEYRVEGPVAILLTTTAVDLDEELRNRCLVLSVNESREQTRAIHRLQREAETLEGLARRRRRAHLVKLHQNAQRLLRPLAVVNPFAPQLTFHDGQTRTRRDHPKYLALIRAITLLHQYQRPLQTREIDGATEHYLEVTLADLEAAHALADEVLGRSLDELPPQSRRVLLALAAWVGETCERLNIDRCDFRFSRREVREALGLSYEQIRVHLDRLVSYEYLLVHRGTRGQSFVYELAWDGRGLDGSPHLPCLLDVEALKEGPKRPPSTSQSLGGLSPTLGGEEGQFGGSNRPQTGPLPGGSRSRKRAVLKGKTSSFPEEELQDSEKARLGEGLSSPSYSGVPTYSQPALPLAARAGG